MNDIKKIFIRFLRVKKIPTLLNLRPSSTNFSLANKNLPTFFTYLLRFRELLKMLENWFEKQKIRASKKTDKDIASRWCPRKSGRGIALPWTLADVGIPASRRILKGGESDPFCVSLLRVVLFAISRSSRFPYPCFSSSSSRPRRETSTTEPRRASTMKGCERENYPSCLRMRARSLACQRLRICR